MEVVIIVGLCAIGVGLLLMCCVCYFREYINRCGEEEVERLPYDPNSSNV